VDASFNSYQRQHDSTCLPDTRVDLLQEIYNWANGQNSPSIFWLSGLAGTGKSTIARTLVAKYSDTGGIAGSFFFSRDGGDGGHLRHARRFVTSIAVQLASNVPTLKRIICDAITEHSDIASRSLREQWRHLVLSPVSKLAGSSYQSPYILVVDALDECDGDNNIQIILELLAEVRSLEGVRLRVFLTSRPEIPIRRVFLTNRPKIPIRHGFYQIPEAEHKDFVLHNISPSIVDHDISIFLEYTLSVIGQDWLLDAAWPGAEVIRCLVQIASGLFIWAATACRYIREGKLLAAERLKTILKESSTAGAVTEPDKHLNEIYTVVLKRSVSPEHTDGEKEILYKRLREIIGSIVILFLPLSMSSLGKLIYVPKEYINQTLLELHSLLDVLNDQTRPLRIHHPSFRDFILNSDRCSDPNLWVDEKQAHQTLADNCIRLMSVFLK
jgi:NACHT domain